MSFSAGLWWCSGVSGVASVKCLHRNPAAILLAVLGQVVLARVHHVRMVVELEGVVPGAATAAAMVVVGAVIVRRPVPEEVSAGQVLAPVRVAGRMLVDPVGQIPMVGQMLEGRTAEGLVGVPTVGLPVLAGRVVQVHGAPVLDVLAQHELAIHVDRVVAMTEASREMIVMVMTAGLTDVTMSAARRAVATVATMNDEGMTVAMTTGAVTTGAVMTDVLEHGTSEGTIQNVEAVDTEEAATPVAGDLGVLRAPSGRRRLGKIIVRRVRSARLVSHVMRPSAVRPRCAHVVVDQLASANSQPNARNISISGLTRVRFEKKSSKWFSVPDQRERIISSLMATFVTELMLRCRLLSVLPNCASAC